MYLNLRGKIGEIILYLVRNTGIPFIYKKKISLNQQRKLDKMNSMGACNRLVMNLLKDITKSEYPVEIPVKHEPYVFEIVNKFINSTEFRTNFPLKMFDLARIKYHVTKNTQVSAVIRKLL